MAIKFCNTTAGVGDPTRPGSIIRLVAGEAWDAADPFVQARPDLFEDLPPTVRVSRAPAPQPVEQATAAPGEQRTVKRGPGRPRKNPEA